VNLRTLSRGNIISLSWALAPISLQFSHSRFTGASPSLRPPLKWVGGELWFVSCLERIWRRNAKSRLVEPFSGALGAALGLRPRRAPLKDVNPHPDDRWIQKGFKAMGTALILKFCKTGGLEQVLRETGLWVEEG
jgi:hypothetical protein